MNAKRQEYEVLQQYLDSSFHSLRHENNVIRLTHCHLSIPVLAKPKSNYFV